VILDGPLGAGKTTFVQGIGRALGVSGQVSSPTFVIARRHSGPGPALLHMDAYRVASAVEVDDLDLDSDLGTSVLVVEWGLGRVESMATDRLEVRIDRSPAESADDPSGGARIIHVVGVGERWSDLACE
jgi:tRNA threonylcarbamoyladenosine biosynthesis protein TsaE